MERVRIEYGQLEDKLINSRKGGKKVIEDFLEHEVGVKHMEIVQKLLSNDCRVSKYHQVISNLKRLANHIKIHSSGCKSLETLSHPFIHCTE